MSATSLPERQRGGFRPGVWLTLATLGTLAILVSLGVWQLQRLAWKTELIERAEARVHQPAVPLPPTEDWAAFDFRRVAAEGTFLPDHALLVGTTARGGEVGGELAVPLALRDRPERLLVDLGWVEEGRFRAGEAAALVPDGPVSLEGVLRYRGDERPGLFTPDPRQEGRRWFAWDIAGVARALDAPFLPVVLVRDGPPLSSAGPVPATVRVDYPNDHLGYAITWFGLAAALLVIFVLLGLKRGRE
jgi:surfeit locus 1 family protein